MARGEEYYYEGTRYILTGEFFSEYLEKTGVKLDVEYSPEQAKELIDANIISVYQGVFTPTRELTGYTIVDFLSDTREQFNIRLSNECKF